MFLYLKKNSPRDALGCLVEIGQVGLKKNCEWPNFHTFSVISP